MYSGIPSTIRSHTARVASGVTSRGATPVPPVVITSCAFSHARISAASIRGCSSGTTSASTTSYFWVVSSADNLGPVRSWRLPSKLESLMVRTASSVRHQQNCNLSTAYETSRDSLAGRSFYEPDDAGVVFGCPNGSQEFTNVPRLSFTILLRSSGAQEVFQTT